LIDIFRSTHRPANGRLCHKERKITKCFVGDFRSFPFWPIKEKCICFLRTGVNVLLLGYILLNCRNAKGRLMPISELKSKIEKQAAQKKRSQPSMKSTNESFMLHTFLALSSHDRARLFATTAVMSRKTGLSQRTLQSWIEVGLIVAIRIGRNYQIYIPSVQSYLNECNDIEEQR
jgi:hypothetical protein